MNVQKTKFLFIRHAESVANLQPEIVGGRRNHAELTSRGFEQSRKLGAFLTKQEYMPDRVYVSPAVRTRQTASEVFGDKYPLFIDDRLQEMTHGKAEGLLRIDVYTPDVIECIDRQGKDFRLGDDAESVNDVSRRMLNFLHEQCEYGIRDISVVTHGIAIKSLVAQIENRPQVWVHKTPLSNASMTELVVHDDELIVTSFGKSPK